MYNWNIFYVYRACPFVWSAIALITGILLACLSTSMLIPTGLVIAGAGYLLFAQSHKNILVIWLIILGSFGWFQYSVVLLDRSVKSEIAQTLNKEEVIYQGIVREINSVDYGFRLLVNNVQVIHDLETYNNDIGYYLYCKEITGITSRDTISGIGSYFKFRSPRNPGEFDFRQFYHQKNIFGRIFQDDKQNILSSQNNSITFSSITEYVRDYIRQTYTNTVGGNGAGLLQALILGDKSKIDPEIKSTFVDTGVIHVLAVSGLHVGYVLIILLFLSRILRIPWGWNRLAVIIGLLFFVILTGAKPSVLRATLMTGLYILGPVVNRPVKIWNIIAAAGFFILLFVPGYLFDLGFLLSFTA
ncbi:MAG: ComEC/Rec2 family competence protein, partial [Candidatus Marinimicrobia bacterium]|nr:ComEC/Rec2 family competence protein [Candidatus Neomarinimicrobiota bacterium]